MGELLVLDSLSLSLVPVSTFPLESWRLSKKTRLDFDMRCRWKVKKKKKGFIPGCCGQLRHVCSVWLKLTRRRENEKRKKGQPENIKVRVSLPPPPLPKAACATGKTSEQLGELRPSAVAPCFFSALDPQLVRRFHSKWTCFFYPPLRRDQLTIHESSIVFVFYWPEQATTRNPDN